MIHYTLKSDIRRKREAKRYFWPLSLKEIINKEENGRELEALSTNRVVCLLTDLVHATQLHYGRDRTIGSLTSDTRG